MRSHRSKRTFYILLIIIFAFWWGISLLMSQEHASPSALAPHAQNTASAYFVARPASAW